MLKKDISNFNYVKTLSTNTMRSANHSFFNGNNIHFQNIDASKV